MKFSRIIFVVFAIFAMAGCAPGEKQDAGKTASEILENPDYLAFSYGGYRALSRDTVPTVNQLKDDMKILSAMGIKIIRTYNTQQFAQAANLLTAIRELKNEDSTFEMYVMLGAWIDCEGAWTGTVNHEVESIDNNTVEIEAAVTMANAYPDIVKVIAVGNEAMVHWAASYYVEPGIILKWVEHLQELKASGNLPAEIWITSSDNFASWGGNDDSYHKEDLVKLIKAVDYISLHTYPYHQSHYGPEFWFVPADEENLSKLEQIDAAMVRAADVAKAQYQSTVDYITSLGIEKPIHIGETGWASIDNSITGPDGSKAADEYKEKLFYEHVRSWTNEAGMSCFFFEAFDERWKDAINPAGSENHFGMINLQGQAKYAIWELVDNGTFNGLTRDGVAITKTYGGDEAALLEDVLAPPLKKEQ